MVLLYILVYLILSVCSYGFIDSNLTLSNDPTLEFSFRVLFQLVTLARIYTAGMYVLLVSILFFLFVRLLQSLKIIPWGAIITIAIIGICSYSMVSYDIFNYMTTAKVTYFHHENPYIVMPIDIGNEPNLEFTRASNKLALYGPAWILLTFVPHVLGNGIVWQTMIAFKLLSACWYIALCIIIWKTTKQIHNVIFFALNPLVIIEILISGHNDIVMMTLFCAGIILWSKKSLRDRLFGCLLFVFSWLVKGATLIIIPLLFIRRLSRDALFFISSILLGVVCVIGGSFREELYPWYAVWLLSTAAFLPYSKYKVYWHGLIAFSFGLELRHAPYIAMGYYEGSGPVLRAMLTILPVGIWFLYIMYKRYNNYNYFKKRG